MPVLLVLLQKQCREAFTHKYGAVEKPIIKINNVTLPSKEEIGFDFIECFTTTFLHAHSWLNWVRL